LQYRTTHTAYQSDGELVEHGKDGKWVATRNELPEPVAYTWRGQRNRMQALTRARILLGLAGNPDAETSDKPRRR
jgi:hypothetical protein